MLGVGLVMASISVPEYEPTGYERSARRRIRTENAQLSQTDKNRADNLRRKRRNMAAMRRPRSERARRILLRRVRA